MERWRATTRDFSESPLPLTLNAGSLGRSVFCKKILQHTQCKDENAEAPCSGAGDGGGACTKGGSCRNEAPIQNPSSRESRNLHPQILLSPQQLPKMTGCVQLSDIDVNNCPLAN